MARVVRAKGYGVFNPVEQDEMLNNIPGTKNFSIRRALRIDCDWICDNCDLMVVLPQHEHSTGAAMEKALAVALDIPIFYLNSIGDDDDIDMMLMLSLGMKEPV